MIHFNRPYMTGKETEYAEQEAKEDVLVQDLQTVREHSLGEEHFTCEIQPCKERSANRRQLGEVTANPCILPTEPSSQDHSAEEQQPNHRLPNIINMIKTLIVENQVNTQLYRSKNPKAKQKLFLRTKIFHKEIEGNVQHNDRSDKVVARRIYKPPKKRIFLCSVSPYHKINKGSNQHRHITAQEPFSVPLGKFQFHMAQAIAGDRKEYHIPQKAAVCDNFQGIDMGIMCIGDETGRKRS
jgi:hypothetical protein